MLDWLKAKIDKRAEEHDAKAAAKDADKAERDASDAVDYAAWASTMLGWPCSTRWTRAPTQTNAPRSPARKRSRRGPSPTARRRLRRRSPRIGLHHLPSRGRAWAGSRYKRREALRCELLCRLRRVALTQQTTKRITSVHSLMARRNTRPSCPEVSVVTGGRDLERAGVGQPEHCPTCIQHQRPTVPACRGRQARP